MPSRAPGKGRGYTYFGAAKKLPGVKELFETEPVKVARRSRYQMHKAIDPDYYGFRCGQRGLYPVTCILDHHIKDDSGGCGAKARDVGRALAQGPAWELLGYGRALGVMCCDILRFGMQGTQIRCMESRPRHAPGARGVSPPRWPLPSPRDEEDGVLERVETEAEKVIRAQVGTGWRTCPLVHMSWPLLPHPFPLHAASPRALCWPLSHGFHAPSPARAPNTQPLAPCTQPLYHPPIRHYFAPPCRHQAVLEWEEKEHERQQALAATSAGARGGAGGEEEGARFVAYVPLPDQQAIEAKILEMKRNDLLAKYTSEALLQQQANAKQLLNKK